MARILREVTEEIGPARFIDYPLLRKRARSKVMNVTKRKSAFSLFRGKLCKMYNIYHDMYKGNL